MQDLSKIHLALRQRLEKMIELERMFFGVTGSDEPKERVKVPALRRCGRLKRPA